MDMHEEEIQARFLSGVDALTDILVQSIERLKLAKEAGKADKPMEAFSHYQAVMGELERLVEQWRGRGR